jgi:Fanconi anemia group M protein
MQILLSHRHTKAGMTPVLSHPLLDDGVEARAYQLKAAKEAISGSTLLVMPTGLGKTAVQWMAMAEAIDGPGRIVLVAPTTGLVAQQAKMAKEFLKIDSERIVTLTGQDRPIKREEIWKHAKIVMATPHVIRNDARNGRILLSEIDLLIVDEAHHATGSDSMAQLGDMYLEASPKALILAATASPGVKAAKVLEIIQRLGIERLHITKRDDDLVQPYITSMDIEKHNLNLPDKLLEIIRPLRILEAEEGELLKRGGFLTSHGRITTAAIEEAQRRASAAIGKGDARGYDAAKRIGDLRRLHRLIDLLDTQGLRCAIMYLERARGDKDRKTKRFLSLPPVANLLRESATKQECHPKPALVAELVSSGLENGGKVIIFTEYRDTVNNLMEILEKIPGIKPGRFVGQASKGSQLGMKQKEQIEQLERFKEGEINVLVATSVGEEGLDVPAADSVILYEPVPSAIRAIQRRGRTARQKDGEVHILIAQGTRDEYVQQASLRREELMYRTLDSLQKQSRLPRRAAPNENVLSAFSVDGENAESFIESEEKRLFREKKVEPQKNPVQKKSTTSTYSPANRPRAQRSLSEFSTSPVKAKDDGKKRDEKWWKPVLDGTITHSRDKESSTASAAQTESDSMSEEKDSQTMIVIDHREANSTLPAMLKLQGHEISMQHLTVGDIRISDRILIERKSARDLVDSLIDGRLIHQARRLHSAAPRPLIIIESNETQRVHPNAIHGAMAWITLDLGLPVIMTGSPEQTARFVSVAAKREARILDLLMSHLRKKPIDSEKSAITAASAEIMSIINGESEVGPLAQKWSNEVVSQRTKILAELPGIGTKTATKIMSVAGDIMGLCMISEHELTQIKGVSSIQARDLFKFLHGNS